MKLHTLPLWVKILIFVTSPIWFIPFTIVFAVTNISAEIWQALFDDDTPKWR